MTITYGKLDMARDKGKHLELFRDVFDKEMSEELFAWKYQDNPHQVDHESCLIYVAKDGDKVVGARSLFPGRVYYKGSWYLGAQAGDTMVHPQYRGQGIFADLLKLSIEDLQARELNVLYNFPNQYSLPGNLRQGATKQSEIVTAVRVLSLLRAFRRERRKRFAAPDLPEIQELSAAKDYILTLGTTVDAQVDDLFTQTFADTGFVAQDRTARHLNWRFGQYPNPYKSYRFLHLWHHDRLVGYAVLSFSGNGVGEVVDYLVMNHSRRLFVQLLRGAMNWYKLIGASHMKIWYSHPSHRRALSTRAFIPKPLNITFVTRYLVPVPFAQASWYISMGDTDTF